MRRIFLGIILSSIGVSASRAADKSAAIFPKGTLTLQTSANFAIGLEQRTEDIPSVDIGVGYFIFNNFSLNLELSGYRASQTGDDAWMGGISGGFRHHLLRFDRYSLFADVDFGPVMGTERVPFDGTKFNFITRTGLGVAAKIDEDFYLLVGARYFHLSNARIDGPERNPSINGIEYYFGLMWLLK